MGGLVVELSLLVGKKAPEFLEVDHQRSPFSVGGWWVDRIQLAKQPAFSKGFVLKRLVNDGDIRIDFYCISQLVMGLIYAHQKMLMPVKEKPKKWRYPYSRMLWAEDQKVFS